MSSFCPLRCRVWSVVKAVWIVVGVLVLSSCKDAEPEIVEQIRSLKTFTVTEAASGDVREFSGIVQATDTTSLSFEVGGHVNKVLVELGASVAKGDVLAVLDTTAYQIAVHGAEAALARDSAAMDEARIDFTRRESLFKKGWASKADYDQARAALLSAQGAVRLARSQLDLAKRGLAKTVLYAPFNGTIAKRDVDPFVEIKAGQKLLEINAQGTLEVALEIPETVISEIAMGSLVRVTLPTKSGTVIESLVTEIGCVASEGNSFPVKVELIDPPESVRAGMTAEAEFRFQIDANLPGYLIPVTAIAPGDHSGHGFAFVYDPKTSTVRKTEIRANGVRDNRIVVLGGLERGDVIAVAGVSFLTDGQKVKLMAVP